MRVYLLVLNHNGRPLLEECLPSALRAAEGSRHQCAAAVIDNDSTDDSVAWLTRHFPRIGVIRRPNRGLCSFNDVVADLGDSVAVLLNNDIKLAPGCIDPLIEPLESDPACFMTAPRCWLFDGSTYEGFKTAVRWRWGLVQATALFPGHEAAIDVPSFTASAGAALAVDCRKFTAIGGFDPLYLPGRLEDLDFAFRGHMAGYHGRYVPESDAYHYGMASFGKAFGTEGCDRLALRNTLLFQWKNLRHPLHVVRHIAALPVRMAYDMCRTPLAPSGRRLAFTRALLAALSRLGRLSSNDHRAAGSTAREREFFRRFHPRRMSETATTVRHRHAGREVARIVN